MLATVDVLLVFAADTASVKLASSANSVLSGNCRDAKDIISGLSPTNKQPVLLS